MATEAREQLDLTLKSKNLEEKLEHCTKYLELNPNDREVWSYKGDILAELGKEEEAITCHVKAAEDDPVEYSAAHVKGGQESIELFDTLLRDKPDFAKGWLTKGSTLIDLGKSEESIECFDKVLELKTGKVHKSWAWSEKGKALVILERMKEAIACCKKALDIDSGSARTWFVKAIALNEMGKYKEAITCFNEVLEILKKNPDHELAKLAKNEKESAEQKLKQQSKSTTREKKGFFERIFGREVSKSAETDMRLLRKRKECAWRENL